MATEILKRQKDGVMVVWSNGEEEFEILIIEYLDTREKRIQWSGEFEVDGKLNVLDTLFFRMPCTTTTSCSICLAHDGLLLFQVGLCA